MASERLSGPELETYLAAVVSALVKQLAPERIVLFGSFARGRQNRASDLDIVVIARTPLAFCDRIGVALAACYGVSTRLPVEALVYTPEEWERMAAAGNSFVAVVAREGRVLYERESDRGAAMAQAGAA